MADRMRESAGSDPEELAEIALSLHDEAGYEGTIGRVLEFAVKELDCAYADVIVVHRTLSIETIAATHPRVAELDRIQVNMGQGPDLEVIREHTGVVVHDTATDQRWPEWARAVAAAGVRSMLGTRLYTTEQTIGSLNFYDLEPGHFGAAELDAAHLLARHAAVALDAARTAKHLGEALAARHQIGVAQGILMARYELDEDRAFAVLRRYSQHSNTKLRTVAQRVVEARGLPDDA